MLHSLRSNAFRILTVCTGYICRSPAAERLLAAELGPHVSVSSVGTGAVVGEPIDHGVAIRLRHRGVSAEGFEARQLRALSLVRPDLVLALTCAHREEVLQRRFADPSRTFTLLEFARIVGSAEFPALRQRSTRRRLHAMVRAADDRRWLGDALQGDDVPDPFGQGPAIMDSSFMLIEDAVATIARVATGVKRRAV